MLKANLKQTFLLTTCLWLFSNATIAQTLPLEIQVNGQKVETGNLRIIRQAEIRMTTSFVGGGIYYTLNGIEPTAAAALYRSPLTITTNVTIRAIAYNQNFSQSAVIGPLTIEILEGFRLQTSVTPTDAGTVEPATSFFLPGTSVSLRATPAPGWKFHSWIGDFSSTAPNIQLTMDRDFKAITQFGRDLKATAVGNGKVLLTPPGPYLNDQIIAIQAIADPGHYFVRWGHSGQEYSPYFFRLPAHMANEFIAVFAPLQPGQHALNLAIEGTGWIEAHPKRNVFSTGEEVSLKMSLNSEWDDPLRSSYTNVFAGWSGSYTGLNFPTINMTESKNVTAHFEGRVRAHLLPHNSGAILNNRSYFITSINAHNLSNIAYSLFDFKVELSFPPVPLPSIPAVRGQTIFVTSAYHCLYSLSTTGDLLWKTATPDGLPLPDEGEPFPPAVGKTTVYYCIPWSERFFALNYGGTTLWEKRIPTSLPPVLDSNENVYLFTRTKLVSYSSSGQLRWEVPAQASFPISIDERNRVCLAAENKVRFYGHSTGSLDDEWTLPAVAATQPIIDRNGSVYLGVGSEFIALNKNGEVRWRYPFAARQPPALAANGTIYVPGESGILAINPDGTGKWIINIPNRWNSPMIAPDGTVLIGSYRDRIDIPGFSPQGFAIRECSPLAPGPWTATRANAQNTGMMEFKRELKLLATHCEGAFTLQAFGWPDKEYTLQRSFDLSLWTDLKPMRDGEIHPEPIENQKHGFYRLVARN